MKNKIKNLLVAFFLLTSVSFGQSEKIVSKADKELPENWTTLSNEKYYIEYPENWELNQKKEVGAEFFLFSELSSLEDKFRENVNLLKQDISGYYLDLDEYAKLTVGQVENLLEDGKILESSRISGNTRDFHKLIFTGTQNGLKLKFEQYFWVVGEDAFILTFTTVANQFEQYKVEGEGILNSFVLKL
ncbi:MAG: hypothetical protein WC044_00260 [Crocinitomicaceae bacterium]